jgi:hypothetical protein
MNTGTICLIDGKPFTFSAEEVEVNFSSNDTPEYPILNHDLGGSITLKLTKKDARAFRRLFKKCSTKLKVYRAAYKQHYEKRITRRQARAVLHRRERLGKIKERRMDSLRRRGFI